MTSKVYQDLAAGLADQNLAETVMRSVGKAWPIRADLEDFGHEACPIWCRQDVTAVDTASWKRRALS